MCFTDRTLCRLQMLVTAALVAASVLVGAGVAHADPAEPPVVPTLEPAKTQQEWSALVRSPRIQPGSAPADCRPLRAVFYTATDWLRFTTKLAANPSPCAQYYISIPP